MEVVLHHPEHFGSWLQYPDNVFIRSLEDIYHPRTKTCPRSEISSTVRNSEENYPSRVLLDLMEKSLNGTPRVAERILNDESAETVSDKKDLSSLGVCSLSLSYKVANHVLSMVG